MTIMTSIIEIREKIKDKTKKCNFERLNFFTFHLQLAAFNETRLHYDCLKALKIKEENQKRIQSIKILIISKTQRREKLFSIISKIDC